MANKILPSPLIVVLGATGTGKSQLAVEIAKEHNGEIINGDAVQMYKGLPIITNKISVEEQQGIPHHLLGTVGLQEETWTVGVFKRRATSIIEEIHSRGKLPILVGGTHYYTQSLLFRENLVSTTDDLDQAKVEHVPREELEQKFPILTASTDDMLAHLRLVDPVMADRWHPNDRRKILRSLEIYLTSGRKASDIYKEQREKKASVQAKSLSEGGETSLLRSALLLWVHADSETLKLRLDTRVDKMVEGGLVDEVKAMELFIEEAHARGDVVDQSRGIWVSIGFKEFKPYIVTLNEKSSSESCRSRSLSEAIDKTKVATRQYARQQIRWIRIKLLAALSGEQALSQLYVLDGSNIDSWESSVSSPARQLVTQFLQGLSLPDATTMSPVAREVLSQKQTYSHGERPDLWIREHCDMCNMTAVTQEQWDNHLKSRSHKNAIKREERRKERLAWTELHREDAEPGTSL